MVKVSNLTFGEALRFSNQLKDYVLEEGEVFDFQNVRTCDPFPMLLASAVVRQLREKSNVKQCIARNCENTYARHMRFYKAIGIKVGRDLNEDYGNSNYLPITRLCLNDLRQDGIQKLERIQEVIARKTRSMAAVLSQGNKECANWLSYVLTEMMRNIPEHSEADSIWYCAQYWPSYDLVELAILDEGIGIKNSLLSNIVYEELISNDTEALKLALMPGISRTFAPGSGNVSEDDWGNSGYGLFMVSRLCDELGGSFILASGNNAVMLQNGKKYNFNCYLNGTGIQIRIRPSEIYRYKEVARKILREGEKAVKGNKNGFVHASKSTKSLFFFDD